MPGEPHRCRTLLRRCGMQIRPNLHKSSLPHDTLGRPDSVSDWRERWEMAAAVVTVMVALEMVEPAMVRA